MHLVPPLRSPLARQDDRPSWLSKPGWLAFAALRAWPLTQMQQLCAALHERLLPLEHPAVQALVRQLVSLTLCVSERWRGRVEAVS